MIIIKHFLKLISSPKQTWNCFLHIRAIDGEYKTTSNLFRRWSYSYAFIWTTSFQVVYGILFRLSTFFLFALGEITFLYYNLYVVFVGLLQFALDGFFMSSTPGGGWFSNNSVLLIAMYFSIGKYSEVFFKQKCKSYLLFNVAYMLLFCCCCVWFCSSYFGDMLSGQ
jgi:hypothetical protein